MNHLQTKGLLAWEVLQFLADVILLVLPAIALIPNIIPPAFVAWTLTIALVVTLAWNVILVIKHILEEPQGADDNAKKADLQRILRALLWIFVMIVVLGVSLALLWFDLRLPYWLPLIWIEAVGWAALAQDYQVTKKLLT